MDQNANDTVGPQRDRWTLKSQLRPDYYEYFPRFSPDELDNRLARLPFHQATLLTEWNIRTAQNSGKSAQLAFERELNLPSHRQRSHLIEVLSAVGISDSVVGAISRIPRDEYVPPNFRSIAYLNTHIPIAAGSCLSPPGTVAIMLDRIHIPEGAFVLEFGVGSGYHLACANQLTGTTGRAVGIDLPGVIHQRPRSVGPKFLGGDVNNPPLRSKSFDIVYTTCMLNNSIPRLFDIARTHGICQVVELLTLEEYASEPPNSSIKLLYPNYRDYRSADIQAYACIREYYIEHKDKVLLGTLYDVSFVHARPDKSDPPLPRIPDFGTSSPVRPTMLGSSSGSTY